MKEYGNRDYADLIDHVLQLLKTHKISQSIVAERINYFSLSKSKNSQKYPQLVIEGKRREEVLSLIMDEFQLAYDNDNESFRILNKNFSSLSEKASSVYYVVYYYSFAKEIVGKGLLTIKDRKWASIEFNDPNHTYSFWKGSFEVVESYTFLYLEKKGDTTPLKAFYSFFSGTIKHGRPFLLGTYSSIKRDGSPTAGKVLIEKVGSDMEGKQKILDSTDKRIESYLHDTNYTMEMLTPANINELPNIGVSDQFQGRYTLYWPYRKDSIREGSVEVSENYSVKMHLENQKYQGLIRSTEKNSLLIELHSEHTEEKAQLPSIIAFINSTNYHHQIGLLSGVVVGSRLFSFPSAFPVLLVEVSKKLSLELVSSYFDQMEGPMSKSIDPLELFYQLKEFKTTNNSS